MPSRKSSIAVVGGGIAGSCAASELSKVFETVIVFDQGQCGPGGRSSHRSVKKSDGTIFPDDDIQVHCAADTLEFDHGCQFFRADSEEMSDRVLPDWISKDWVKEWDARLGSISVSDSNKTCDFFGVPCESGKVYIGNGGMHQIPRKILADSRATVHRGTRVSSVRKSGEKWELCGTKGKAAYHDTKESDARQQSEEVLATVDAVVFTDISSASDSWHRASAGIPDSLRKKLPEKLRLPLFSCMVALSNPVADLVPFDGFTVNADSDLWFAARSQSKPGFPQSGSECWTLISTPSFAVKQIKETTMRDPNTGAFRPQENSYLNSVPGPALFDAFLAAIKPYLSDSEPPKAIYLQAQRWGSGLPVPALLVDEEEEILGTRYCSKLKSSLVFGSHEDATDCLADDQLRLYYAGDFCSGRNPGFEAAALSGIHVAKQLVESNLE